MGRFGPMVQKGSPDDEEKPKYAKLRAGQNIETITLEQAIELFKLPRKLGEWKDGEIIASEGRFGPYLLFNKKFYSIKADPFTVNFDEAVQIITEKDIAAAEKLIRDFADQNIQILKGPYGPYIKQGKKNVKIPKETDPMVLTLEECMDMIEKAPEKKRRSFAKKS